MIRRKKSLQGMAYVFVLLIAVIILFQWFTTNNSRRMIERNKNYAADSAHLTADKVDEKLKNARSLITAYAYFLEESLQEPVVSAEMLKRIEDNSSHLFNALIYTDAEGKDHSSDGRIADVTQRDFYQNGIKGRSGMDIIFDPYLFDEPMACFYSPVYYYGQIIGVLRGAFLAEENLKEMLKTTYFGEDAWVYLCMPDGSVIASSDDREYTGDVLEILMSENVIDQKTAEDARKVFTEKGEGVFVCDSQCKTDNICVMYLPESEYVLVQTFPKTVTQAMIDDENLVGIQLEIILIIMFAIYIVALFFRSKREKKLLKQENQEMGYIIKGINTLFPRFVMVDFEKDTYRYLAGSRPEDSNLAETGAYRDFYEYLYNALTEESEREEFAEFMDRESMIQSLMEHEDLRHECQVMKENRVEWAHINVVCLERKEGRAVKVLFSRQNITELKEKELLIQAEMSLANRKERQYRIAITSNALCTFDFNLTRDMIENDIIRTIHGKKISMLKEAGLKAPCRASECFASWRKFVLPESLENYDARTSLEYLKECFAQGEGEADVEYWEQDPTGAQVCVRQSFLMVQDDDTGDVMVMVVTKDITESEKKQREQTQALQDALMQAQHANRAKTTFLSNMSHDIRTPMNAIIGFATIALSHINSKEQVHDSLQKVLSSSNHLLSLINDILDMSRIESGKVQIKEQECNISEMMHNLVNIIQPQVKAKQLELFIDTFEVVNEDVIADSLKMNQVFINLLSNAVKYTPAGGSISFRITQKSTFRHGYGDYIFTIKDNGIGMAPEFVAHIFEPFEREASATQSGIQGTGLGMAITKNIVEMMNGTIRVESEVGHGSTFTVEFTLKLQDVEKDAELIKELEGQRALVVDDDINTCDSVSKMLKEIGLRAEWTTSGREAIYRARSAYEDEDAYHTYIIDWQMPETSGLETAKRIRSVVGNDVPIIILTAYDWTDIEEEAMEAGITAFCAKPLFMSDLKSALLSANSPSEKEEETAVWQQADFSGKRVLLVDDIELNREIAEIILTEAGFVVESAPDGTDAVAMVRDAQENYYDVVLMDVQMPIMNGYEATRTIRNMQRKDVKDLPIIAMTANALEEDKEAALKNGMNAHIAKPLDMDIFMDMLKKFLG
ncbi:hypothetical protein C805_02509 [Eubacterium sp. 14-2]|uniref:hybrid sensor histidine kinase/response regulator n=1 Tax=Eubacterium sp. 14-2 TaxID=1235790 RepID=UPI00033CE553|nr:hybrid sensor histidine kinase/response regulator [Eubacterium sp. 14-2]EOT24297.1 hypothetical protein C805_02509 [Eubacterium sp. 14-2]